MKIISAALIFVRCCLLLVVADSGAELVKVGAEVNQFQLGGSAKYPNSSWSLKERAHPEAAPQSSVCSDFFTNYKKYFILLSRNGFDTCNVTIEWSDFQPDSPETFNEDAIHSLLELLQIAKRLNIEPTITLIDGTTPIWFEKEGGFRNAENIPYFINFVETVVSETAEYAKDYILFKSCSAWVYELTSNNSYLTFCDEYSRYMSVIVDAQIKAYTVIKNIDPSLRVGVGCRQNFPQVPRQVYDLPSLGVLSKNYWINDFFYNVISKDRLLFILPFWVYLNEDLSNKATWYDFISYHYEFSDKLSPDEQCDYILNQIKALNKNVSLYVKCSNRDPEKHRLYFQAIQSMIDSIEEGELAIDRITFQSLVDCYEWKNGYNESCGLFGAGDDAFSFYIHPGTQSLIQYMSTKKMLRQRNSLRAIEFDYESFFES